MQRTGMEGNSTAKPYGAHAANTEQFHWLKRNVKVCQQAQPHIQGIQGIALSYLHQHQKLYAERVCTMLERTIPTLPAPVPGYFSWLIGNPNDLRDQLKGIQVEAEAALRSNNLLLANEKLEGIESLLERTCEQGRPRHPSMAGNLESLRTNQKMLKQNRELVQIYEERGELTPDLISKSDSSTQQLLDEVNRLCEYIDSTLSQPYADHRQAIDKIKLLSDNIRHKCFGINSSINKVLSSLTTSLDECSSQRWQRMHQDRHSNCEAATHFYGNELKEARTEEDIIKLGLALGFTFTEIMKLHNPRTQSFIEAVLRHAFQCNRLNEKDLVNALCLSGQKKIAQDLASKLQVSMPSTSPKVLLEQFKHSTPHEPLSLLAVDRVVSDASATSTQLGLSLGLSIHELNDLQREKHDKESIIRLIILAKTGPWTRQKLEKVFSHLVLQRPLYLQNTYNPECAPIALERFEMLVKGFSVEDFYQIAEEMNLKEACRLALYGKQNTSLARPFFYMLKEHGLLAPDYLLNSFQRLDKGDKVAELLEIYPGSRSIPAPAALPVEVPPTSHLMESDPNTRFQNEHIHFLAPLDDWQGLGFALGLDISNLLNIKGGYDAQGPETCFYVMLKEVIARKNLTIGQVITVARGTWI